MNSRIALVIKTKNISPSQLADDLGVQRSGISHIINGRNKPSLEFVQKLIKLYPDISMHWILFGEGPMMNPYPGQVNFKTTEKPAELFPEETPKPFVMELFSTLDDQSLDNVVPEEGKVIENLIEVPVNAAEEKKSEAVEDQSRKIITPDDNRDNAFEPLFVPEPIVSVEAGKKVEGNRVTEYKEPEQPEKAVRKISRILVFYNDRTFVEYSPGEEIF